MKIIPNQWSDWYTYKSGDNISFPKISTSKKNGEVTITVSYSKGKKAP